VARTPAAVAANHEIRAQLAERNSVRRSA
jgi:hypothetical protein